MGTQVLSAPWGAPPLTPCGSQKVMHTRKRHSELYHELNQKFHTFDRYRSQSTAKVSAPPVAAPAPSRGPNRAQWPLQSDPGPWSPVAEGEVGGGGYVCVSPGGAAERSVSSISTPDWVGVRRPQPQPASPRACLWHKQQSGVFLEGAGIGGGSPRTLRRMGRQETWSQGATLSTGVRNPALEPVGLDLNLTLIGGNVGHHQPSLGLLSWLFCTVVRGCWPISTCPFCSAHRRSPVQGSVLACPNSGDIRAGAPSSL